MAWFAEEFNSLHDLLVQQLGDLYDAELRLVDALPNMATAAHNPELKAAFEKHLEETRGHIERLDRVFELIGAKASAKTCQGMKGLIREGEDMIDAKGDESVRDAGLIGAAQRVEHYEMAGYGTVRNFAQQLGLNDVAQLLQQTLDEEGLTDKKLTAIAEVNVNLLAVH